MHGASSPFSTTSRESVILSKPEFIKNYHKCLHVQKSSADEAFTVQASDLRKEGLGMMGDTPPAVL